MTQADSVHSTPPTNTSATNPPGPVDTTRRRFITIAAGASIISVGSLAAVAMPISATPVSDAPIDPIYAAIERHKAAGIVWDAAVDVRSNFNDLHMTDEQREQRDLLDDAVEDAWEPCEQAGIDLITTKPTTPAGIITAIRYIQIQMRDDGTYMPQGVEFEYTEGSAGDSRAAMGWIDAFLDTLADAATELDLAGKAVQS
jgi:hypothetical protein